MAIHPTAVIDPKAEIDRTADIGPYVSIEGPVRIGPHCQVKAHAFLSGWTELGEGTEVHPFAVVGHLPQDFHYEGQRSYCRVGRRVVIREGVTVHRGTQPESATIIGDECFLMAYSHVGHNCVLGTGTKVYNLTLLAGHVEADERVIFSASSMVHQFTRVGKLAFVAGGARITCDVPPFMTAFGMSTIVQYNVIGMRRAGYDKAAIDEIHDAFRVLYRAGLPRRKAVDRLAGMVKTDAGRALLEFIRVDSARGYCAAGSGHRRRGEAPPVVA
ncbi:MAG: acyl-ACP--UDP-N-acetylglucosamine O-acyltransferase [Phycisphaerae bacterium]|nr:acyl-ACP--UDP-N-acetylglucosamine O-acyltransferase [Phycisphaerae bacterium]